MTPRERHAAIKALVEQATTPGEKAAAEKALARHEAKHGVPEIVPEVEPEVERSEPFGDVLWMRWKRIMPPLSAELWRAQTPSYERVFMSCITTRKAHQCNGCSKTYPERSRLWRPIAYNGNHRMDRFCCHCFAADPEAPTAIEER